MINRQRLTDEFARLAAITSPPLREGAIARYLAERLALLGAEILFDRADQATGGEIGNLIARFPAAGRDSEPLLMSVHIDTVEPGAEVIPVLNDAIFTRASGTGAAVGAIAGAQPPRHATIPIKVMSLTICSTFDFYVNLCPWGLENR